MHPSLSGHVRASPVHILLDSDFTAVCFILSSTAVTASELFLGEALHFWYFMSGTLRRVLNYRIMHGATLHIRPNWSPSNKHEICFSDCREGEIVAAVATLTSPVTELLLPDGMRYR